MANAGVLCDAKKMLKNLWPLSYTSKSLALNLNRKKWLSSFWLALTERADMAKSFGRRAQKKFLFLVNYPDFLFLIDKKADQFDTRVTTKLVNRGPLIPLVRKIWQFLDFFREPIFGSNFRQYHHAIRDNFRAVINWTWRFSLIRRWSYWGPNFRRFFVG